ncbi:hypothetical protein [Streptomyces sp. DH12]|uniref:hypothetical protein n=1 Tax=Streptomyces sp. DH12 TaxID=2857010 RepID=UPI001E45E421|nr:hypothetical protein [Streptomyces sp. DH12]
MNGQRPAWEPKEGNPGGSELVAWVEHLRDLLASFPTDQEAATALRTDKGKVSTYVNGLEVPTLEFVKRLLREARPNGNQVTEEVRTVTRALHVEAVKAFSPNRAKKYQDAYMYEDLSQEVGVLKEERRLLRRELDAVRQRAAEKAQWLRAQHSQEKARLAEEVELAQDQVRALEQRLADAEQRIDQAREETAVARRELVEFRSAAGMELVVARRQVRELQDQAAARERVHRLQQRELSEAAQEKITALEEELAHTRQELAVAEERADEILGRLVESRAEIERIRTAEDHRTAAEQAVAEALDVVDDAYARQQADAPRLDEGTEPPKSLVTVTATIATTAEAGRPPGRTAPAGPGVPAGAGRLRSPKSPAADSDKHLSFADVLQIGACVLALAAIVLGIIQAVDAHAETVADLHAPVCPSGVTATAQQNCVGRETGQVVQKMRSLGENMDRLNVKRPSGATEIQQVEFDIYRAVREGSTVDLTVWKGDIVAVSAAGKTTRIRPLPHLSLLWIALLIGLGTVAIPCALKGSATPWKTAAWVALGCCFETYISVGFVVESPYWWLQLIGVLFCLIGAAVTFIIVITFED